MLELLRKLGLPTVSASTQGPAIDNVISLVHWLMLILFVGWGAYFIYTLIRFRSSQQPKADYHGVKNHYSTYAEVAVALIEVVLLIGFAFPIWASRVNDVPDTLDSIQIRVVAQQFAWNIHYPGPDNVFGSTNIDLVNDEEQNFIGLDRTDEYAKDDVVLQNQLKIPVNTPINILLSSRDVIHNFKLPELRVSQDAIPGMTIPVWFEATMTTEEFDSFANSKLTNNEPYRGGEPFSDSNNNGKYDVGEDFIDIIIENHFYDPWDYFTDKKNGKYDEGENFVDNNSNGEYDVGEDFTDKKNGKYDAGEYFVDQANNKWDPPKGFEIACAQLCGLTHSQMKGYLTIYDKDGYNAWMDQEQQFLLEEAEDEDDWGDDEW